jgi:hypothetical protein
MDNKSKNKSRVLIGEVRTHLGRDYVVMRTRRGEVVVGGGVDGGGVVALETRSSATVAGWPRVGRVRLSYLASGGYAWAPWLGRPPVAWLRRPPVAF